MKTRERISLIRKSLSAIVERGTESSYMVTRGKASEKIILFNHSGNEKVTMDVPYGIMRKDEKKRFVRYYGEKFHQATYAYTKETTVEEATVFVEGIFKKIFQLPDNFSIEVELELD